MTQAPHKPLDWETFDAPRDPPWNGWRQPVFAFAVLYVIFFAVLVGTASSLPPRMATHFDLQGRPNGWMSRATHLWLMGATGGLTPLLILGLTRLIAVTPVQLVNLPNREYWLAPERREATLAVLARQMGWLACYLLLYFTALSWLLVQANRQQPVRLSNAMWVVTAVFLLAVVGWTVNLYGRFGRVPRPVNG